jgi:hypothetical protein
MPGVSTMTSCPADRRVARRVSARQEGRRGHQDRHRLARADHRAAHGEEADHVDVAEHLLDEIVEPLTEEGPRLVDARRVDDDE